MFENERFFSHLSALERELSFRTEMGLYYSYYKTIVEAPTFLDGLHAIMNCNVTEFPDTINTLKRFNLYPEVCNRYVYNVIKTVLNSTAVSKWAWQGEALGVGWGFSFRMYDWITTSMKIHTKTCYTDHSCVVLIKLSCLHSALQIYKSIPLGMGELSFFYVYAIFYLSGLMISMFFLLCFYLSGSIFGGLIGTLSYFYNHGEALAFECTRVMWTPPLRESFSYPFLVFQLLAVTLTIKSSNAGWRHLSLFAQFALLTQTCALFGLYFLRLITSHKLCMILFGMLAIQGVSFVAGTVGIKFTVAKLLGIADDAHITSILRSKFTDFRNFDTSLYTCAPEFDFLDPEAPQKLIKTLVLPSAIVAMIAVIAKHFYHLLQALAFVAMAIIIMRLKLFGTPSLCVMASLLASRKLFASVCDKRKHQAFVILLIAAMSVQGIANLKGQFDTKGEYNNPEQEELVGSVFAGAMPTMATVKLCTRRAIVNHPHYEDVGIRERTHKVYEIFSRKPPAAVWETLNSMKVTHVVIDTQWCLGRPKPGCGMVDIWDLEDKENIDRPSCCHALEKDARPFKRVFSNQKYKVYKLR
ncbi:putative C-mannosyltransferase DPY19L1 [Acropora cervicornis]|uniref:C-mannosyltransferase DPY19L1 n=1 Tax=Acropora cervicornis TaxID=6130 RepID=A0AAD9V5N3_ACRCE|nr:putative C-mannosyltransferase DPY19L1 [Acropora cervicornis]